MIKKLFLSTVCLCLGFVANAGNTDVSQYENVVFPVSTTGSAGSTVTVSVEMNNTVDATGFQFDIFLPEGITIATDEGFYLIELSEARTTSRKTDYFNSSYNEEVGAPRVLCNSTLSYTFEGNSGEVCTIKLNIGEDVADGDYPIIFKNIVISDVNSAAYYVDDPIEATLTVKAAAFEEGYAVEVLPFAMKEDLEVYFVMDNLTDITNIALDVKLPSAFVNGELYYIDNPLGKTKFNVSDELNPDGTIHAIVDRRSSNKIDAGSGTAIITLGLAYDGSAVPAGVYPITIKNIELTDVDGKSYLAAPYSTEIFVGDAPKATVTDGVTAFHGNYGGADEYALLTSALPEGAMIDLTEVSAMAEDPTTLKKNNVIVTADAVAYSRTLPNAWGTLCLPFAIETDDNIQLYEFTRATSTGLFFEKITSAAANTPLIFKATGDVSFKIPNDGTFEVGYANLSPNLTPSVDNWVVNGSYIDETVDVSSMQAYALYEGEFRRATSRINVKAFHAWLQNNGEPMGAAIRISEGTDGIDIIEQEDGSIKLIYDMQGRQLKNGEGQQIYIENGKKVISINN